MTIRLLGSPEILRDKFYALRTRREIAELLELPYSRFIFHVYKTVRTTQYTSFSVPKRRGGSRLISAPVTPLKIIQRKLHQVLLAVYQPKSTVHGFLPERSIVTNAKDHSRRKFVLNVDLEDFFPSINFGRVYGMFKSAPYKRNDHVASLLAAICCHEKILPQGAPTSPIVSNMICSRMDSQLRRMAQRYRCAYTRYGDDITFSTNFANFPEALAVEINDEKGRSVIVGHELGQLVRNNGFTINNSKVRLQRQSDRQEVTGLTTNQGPNVQRRFARQIRAMLHAWKKFDLDLAQKEFATKFARKHKNPIRSAPSFVDTLKGKIEFLGMVRGKSNALYLKYRRQLRVLAPHLVKDLEPPSNLDNIRKALWVLESYDPPKQGTAFALEGYGLLTCAHALGKDTVAFRDTAPTKRFRVKIVRQNEDLDLAILSIDCPITDSLLMEVSSEPSYHDAVIIASFPSYQLGDSARIARGEIVAFRAWRTMKKILVSTSIVKGNSGGPAVNAYNRVIGIAVTGSDRIETASETEDHGLIPIGAIKHLGS